MDIDRAQDVAPIDIGLVYQAPLVVEVPGLDGSPMSVAECSSTAPAISLCPSSLADSRKLRWVSGTGIELLVNTAVPLRTRTTSGSRSMVAAPVFWGIGEPSKPGTSTTSGA